MTRKPTKSDALRLEADAMELAAKYLSLSLRLDWTARDEAMAEVAQRIRAMAADLRAQARKLERKGRR